MLFLSNVETCLVKCGKFSLFCNTCILFINGSHVNFFQTLNIEEMDTDDDKDLKPPLSNVTSATVNTTTPSINGPTNNSNSTPLKVKEEIKEEPMEIENTKTNQEKKSSGDKEKRTATSGQTCDDIDIPMVNGTLSDSDKEQDTAVSF